MIATRSTVKFGINELREKLSAYVALMKFRLSFLVAFSSAFGYVLASQGPIDFFTLAVLSLAGFLISGASITINQIIERDLDKLMSRTKNRPLPTNKVSIAEASLFALLNATAGLWMLLQFTNILTAGLSLLSLIAYSFVYTPLKRVGPVAVLVGAFPGALPPLLGWVAYSGQIGPEALVLFGIQFIWQFPHFWAIAWVADEDYKKAGFKLLPSGGGKDLKTAVQIMTYALFLIPLGLLPLKFGITGIDSAIVATLCGALFLFQTFRLMVDCSRKSALKIMFGSFIYLPVVQIAFLLDKI
ncbi:protoheme IX farnesyltransferase [Catalinimonas alkaloidigena]|uniref:heme o synthase n=1 Tax=Catalinimonas alkaloidigena TaxID=1075417 RepID=UPI002405C394|nr:heme o synthase [Catalinimonas alkaloidigena]MDF9796918.1 protoheme IX farnesyltransferase [Catalinimonas alkaloidigena]